MNSVTSGEGRIRIQLRRRGQRVEDVLIESSRAVSACRVLVGRKPEEAPAVAASLFGVCRQAQSLACRQACEAALGRLAVSEQGTRTALGVETEILREHAWRFLLDWPARLHVPARDAEMRQILVLLQALEASAQNGSGQIDFGQNRAGNSAQALDELETMLTAVIAGPKGRAAIDTDGAAFADWCTNENDGMAWLFNDILHQGLASIGRSGVTLMSELDLAALDTRLAKDSDGGFVSAPDWDGAGLETGPLARHQGHSLVKWANERAGLGLLARLVARLVDLFAGLARIRQIIDESQPPAGTETLSGEYQGRRFGLARVETARGSLIHRVEIQGDAVHRYQILAPTEWNFHPRCGPLVAGLAGLTGKPDQLEHLAKMVVTALDPCVDYELCVA